ncbi:MAG: amidohydrolase [Planctomycetaceae bacterium]|nr:amidohydrolase [Planctomycetaceae bacterium]
MLKEQAFSLREWSVKHRRTLHRQPELSLKEDKTSAHCRGVLKELGFNVRDCWGYGFTADLDVPGAKKRIALRADMDALPIQELNTHDYVSCCPGVAHMCGHDTHMTIAMTTARLLVEQKNKLKTNVRFLFQPCEETPPGGALGMIEKGCLDGVDEVYGLHNEPGTPIGTVRLCAGAMTAAADRFTVTIRGVGGHAARPQDCLDPIVAAAQTINEWQTLVSRRINPMHPAVLSVANVHAGTTFNIIPDEATLQGTVRTFFDEDRKLIETQMRATLAGLEGRGYKTAMEYIRGYASIVNHESGVKRVAEAAGAVLGANNVDTKTEGAAWGEDFAYYLLHKPGAFFMLGSGNKAKGIVEPLHSARFDVDEDCLPLGAAIMAELVMRV